MSKDVRTNFYLKSNFISGYPAATGIGMNTGGVVVDFIALKGNDKVTVIPVKSSVQVDAHMYMPEVLGNNALPLNVQKTTPKFERAKLVTINNSGIIYISGTAAIIGQNSILSNDVTKQTQITLENIQKLISNENLLKNGLRAGQINKQLKGLRVYVKYASDIGKVKEICKKNYPNTPVLLVESDVCRDDLLVEKC